MAMTEEERKAFYKACGERSKGNLIPITERSPEEALQMRRKGQQALTEKKRKRKELKEICNDILALSAESFAKGTDSAKIGERLKEAGIEATVYDLIVAKQTENALNGSTKSAEFVRDSAGDKPTDKLEMQADIITESDRALLASISDRLDSLEAVETMSICDTAGGIEQK